MSTPKSTINVPPAINEENGYSVLDSKPAVPCLLKYYSNASVDSGIP